jgi:hypothetical protein
MACSLCGKPTAVMPVCVDCARAWAGYDAAAEKCARRLIDFGEFDVPEDVDPAVAELIYADTEAFDERVRASAYALAMGDGDDQC